MTDFINAHVVDYLLQQGALEMDFAYMQRCLAAFMSTAYLRLIVLCPLFALLYAVIGHMSCAFLAGHDIACFACITNNTNLNTELLQLKSDLFVCFRIVH